MCSQVPDRGFVNCLASRNRMTLNFAIVGQFLFLARTKYGY